MLSSKGKPFPDKTSMLGENVSRYILEYVLFPPENRL